ncbi:unnamed protein product [Linum tenue]|uniref:F-box domain-containing protein n=1 Tax=Linum tenue TaxID=586396 RepID=A0AAV0LN39_9ROSI|nr:unnamed protein product [Linum tenue]
MAGPALSSSKALCINELLVPHHLLEEVLVRIPLRDVFRCMSVCKLWLACIQDSPYFVTRFIRRRIETEEAYSQHLLYKQCLSTGFRLVATPIYCNVVDDGSDLSLNFLPLLAEEGDNGSFLVRGSSNGLLLCSSFGRGPCIYYICNPLTKQWLTLPPSPYGHQGRFRVGLVCEPSYHVKDEDGSLISLNDKVGFKVVRWGYIGGDLAEVIHFEIFSSDTVCWTTYKSHFRESDVHKAMSGTRIFFSHDRMIYWLLEGSEILVFNFYTEESCNLGHLALPSNALLAPFKGFNECQGSLWLGQSLGAQVRVYILVDGEWCLRHDVNFLDEMHWSSSSAKDALRVRPDMFNFHAMHPSDPTVGYLSASNRDPNSNNIIFLECDFAGRIVKVVAGDLDGNEQCDSLLYVLPFSLPLWPTPLPALPTA